MLRNIIDRDGNFCRLGSTTVNSQEQSNNYNVQVQPMEIDGEATTTQPTNNSLLLPVSSKGKHLKRDKHLPARTSCWNCRAIVCRTSIRMRQTGRISCRKCYPLMNKMEEWESRCIFWIAPTIRLKYWYCYAQTVVRCSKSLKYVIFSIYLFISLIF